MTFYTRSFKDDLPPFFMDVFPMEWHETRWQKCKIRHFIIRNQGEKAGEEHRYEGFKDDTSLCYYLSWCAYLIISIPRQGNKFIQLFISWSCFLIMWFIDKQNYVNISQDNSVLIQPVSGEREMKKVPKHDKWEWEKRWMCASRIQDQSFETWSFWCFFKLLW